MTRTTALRILEVLDTIQEHLEMGSKDPMFDVLLDDHRTSLRTEIKYLTKIRRAEISDAINYDERELARQNDEGTLDIINRTIPFRHIDDDVMEQGELNRFERNDP